MAPALRFFKIAFFTLLIGGLCACACRYDKQTVAQMQKPDAGVTFSSSDTQGMILPPPTGASFAPGTHPDYEQIVKTSSNSSVQIFNLDGPAATNPDLMVDATLVSPSFPPLPSAQAPVAPAGPEGVTYSMDKNVQVFPFDDAPQPLPSFQTALPAPQDDMSPIRPLSPGPVEIDGSTQPMDVSQGESSKIYFANGSAKIGRTGQQVIEQLAADSRSNVMVSVEGHASKRTLSKDPKVAQSVNLKISMQRAVAVSEALIDKGIPVESVRTVAWGDSKPPFLTVPGMSAEAASRRVEIFAKSK